MDHLVTSAAELRQGGCVSELGFTVPPTRGHTEGGPRFKVSSERPEKRGVDHAIAGLIVQLVILSKSAAPAPRWEGLLCELEGHSNE